MDLKVGQCLANWKFRIWMSDSKCAGAKRREERSSKGSEGRTCGEEGCCARGYVACQSGRTASSRDGSPPDVTVGAVELG